MVIKINSHTKIYMRKLTEIDNKIPYLLIISSMCFLSSSGFCGSCRFIFARVLRSRSARLPLGVDPVRLLGRIAPLKLPVDFFLASEAASEAAAGFVLLIQLTNMSWNHSSENWYITSIPDKSARTKYIVAPLVATCKYNNLLYKPAGKSLPENNTVIALIT